MLGLNSDTVERINPFLVQTGTITGESYLAFEVIHQTRPIIIASNRAPVTFHADENGVLQPHRGGGGLVTALTGLINHANACWIACSQTDEDRLWGHGSIPFNDTGHAIQIQFISPDESAYEGYYQVIANPLLWFLQHSMWDIFRTPTIDRQTWEGWKNGYVAVNQLFSQAVAQQILAAQQPPLVMLQDYHLYLAAKFIRQYVPPNVKYTLLHFIHIPWPGAEDWGLLPAKMRQAILEGLCAVDLLGFQTREDGLNFIRTCESYLPGAQVNFKRGRIWYNGHSTHVRDFPISIDVGLLKRSAESGEVAEHRAWLKDRFDRYKLIVRIDRIEPSKNIVRGFQAFDEMLELHPEHRDHVRFLALLVPSRMEVEEYKNYLGEIMSAAGKVNAKYGSSDWEPIRILVGEDYHRAVAALQLYDVLLVNSIADGMNLVAKEGPIVNQRNGILILSERTGARQQLETGALVISPLDTYATAEAMNQALTMPLNEREVRARRLRSLIEHEDIVHWLSSQLETVEKLNL